VNVREVMSHGEAIELLPWLVNDSLDNAERDSVLEHARSCVICRREMADLESLRNSVSHAAGLTATPALDMRRINARIDAWENRDQALMSRLRELIGSPWRVAFAAQTVLLIVLGTALLWPDRDGARFTTLTAPEKLPDGYYVRVVFDPDLGAGELSRLLGQMNLTVIAGPSERGVYTLSIPGRVSATERDAVVSDLLTHSGVLFAQPVARGAPQ